MAHLLAIAASLIVLGPGALAPADPLVLETVEVKRVRYGWGLDDFAGVGVVRLAVEDCNLLGYDGWLMVEGATYRARVVDCQQKAHTPLSELGILADVNKRELGHKKGLVILWQSQEKQMPN
jgi:hypothetical protein